MNDPIRPVRYRYHKTPTLPGTEHPVNLDLDLNNVPQFTLSGI